MDAKITVDKGIPIPADRERRGKSKYPWRGMDVGDSFLCATGTVKSIVTQISVVNGRLAPRHFVCVRVDGGQRVWRDK